MTDSKANPEIEEQPIVMLMDAGGEPSPELSQIAFSSRPQNPPQVRGSLDPEQVGAAATFRMRFSLIHLLNFGLIVPNPDDYPSNVHLWRDRRKQDVAFKDDLDFGTEREKLMKTLLEITSLNSKEKFENAEADHL